MFGKYSTYIRVRSIENVEIDREEMSEKSVNHWVLYLLERPLVGSGGPGSRVVGSFRLLLPVWLLLQQTRCAVADQVGRR